jgi:hypothetical protein
MCVARRTAVSIALALLASHALASDAPFFGPKRLAIETGKPQLSSQQILVDANASCEGKAAFILMVENNGVSSAEVRINGSAVLTERDFSQSRTLMEKPLILRAENQLSISLNGGKAGSFIDVSIRREIESSIAPRETYVLNTGRQVFTRTYHAPDAAGIYTLVVGNGNDAGNARVNSGTISLDGIVVLSERELNASTDLLRTRIPLHSDSLLTADLKGESGDSLTVEIHRQLPESVCERVVLAWTTPGEGEVVDTRAIVAQGTATGPNTLGVTVNGIPADLDLTRAGTAADPYRWLAIVPAEAGAVTLSATPSTVTGDQSAIVRHVQFAPPEEWIVLEPSSRSGPVPFTATFHFDTSLSEEVASYEFDLDGDGTFELASAILPEDVHYTYTLPGTPTVAARVTTRTGRTFLTSTTIFVHSFAAMNELLQRQWRGFVSALESGSVEAALQYLAGAEAKQKYKRGLELIRPTLSEFAAGLSTIKPIWISEGAAHYLLTRVEGTQLHGYHVYFVRDLHGVWRIAQF